MPEPRADVEGFSAKSVAMARCERYRGYSRSAD
jgi:hypothetical protein